MDRKKLVIVGNGMAGTACIEEILKADPKRYEITVFGKERHLNYNRVLLSHVLTGEKTLNDISLHGAEWYSERGIRLKTSCKVTLINRAGRKALTEGGGEEHFDKLIIATGSVPFMPPIPGTDKEGVVTFRDIDDCERIRQASKDKGRAVVIGGGLLGLEAARGLLALGMDVTVVHLMDRLMEKQLDNIAAGFLKEDLERLGIDVLLGKETVEIRGNGRAEGVAFRDGSSIEADLVVLSIGIRPNVELAKASGIYCEKGIVVSDTMQTYDPAVYSVGECVQHRGEVFGLVGPIFEQARVAANHLASDGRMVFKNTPASTRLKVTGIDLYSAGKIAENGDSIEYLDKGGRLYKRLFLNENRLEGILMYGNSSNGPALFQALMDGEDIGHRRHSLLFENAAEGKGGPVQEIPDDAIVCGCSGVTKREIVEAIEKKGLFTRDAVKRETKASGSCGGCAGLVERILEETLGSDFRGSAPQAVCGCTRYTRDDIIKNIREKRLTSVSKVMETLGWETVGCDQCRPAINYYVSMVWPLEAMDDGTSRLVNERAHANIQKDGTFSVVPRMYGGVTTPQELKRIADTAVKYGVPLVKVTGGQRIDLVGIKKEELESVWKDLDMPSGFAYAKAVRTVKTCVGERFCRYGTQDSMSLGTELERMLSGLWMPAKVKMAVSGCPRNCAESSIKDIGIVGISGGWEVYAGGCGGIELKGAERILTVKTREEAIETVSAFLQHYREDAHYGERTYKWVGRKGLDLIRKEAIEDERNRKGLCERLREALAAVKDPWKERLAN